MRPEKLGSCHPLYFRGFSVFRTLVIPLLVGIRSLVSGRWYQVVGIGFLVTGRWYFEPCCFGGSGMGPVTAVMKRTNGDVFRA